MRFSGPALVLGLLALAGPSHAHSHVRVHARAAAVADTSVTRIPIPDPVIEANRPRAQVCVDSARVAAAADRHHDAIRWYRQAIALYPPLASDLGKELGHQYTWAEEPDSALSWYRLDLQHHPDDVEAEAGAARALAWAGRLDESLAAYRALLPHSRETETDVRIAIAQVTSWKDDLDGARLLYEDVLRDEPANLEARLGLARVINWSGRHREAAAHYREILADHPDNAEAREGLAQSYSWMGRPDRARAVIHDGEATPGLTHLETELDRARAPEASYTFEHNTDSDRIERNLHTVRAGVSTGDLTRGFAEYGHGSMQQPGRPDVARNWLGAVLERRFSDTAALHAAAGYQWNAFDRAALSPATYWKDDFNLFTVDSYATLTPRDGWRFDLSLFHGSLNVPDAIFRGISVTELGAGWDLRLRTTTTLASSLASAWYSDANSRLGWGERLVWQPVWRLPIAPKNRLTSTTGMGYFSFAKTRNDGYYNPRQYLSLYEELAVDATFSERLQGRVAGRVGLDRENGSDWFDTGRIEASLTAGLWRGVTLTAGYFNSNSRLDSREGYQADGFYLTLGYTHAR
jgi:tetratricopeptide (TPR) repeat protein